MLIWSKQHKTSLSSLFGCTTSTATATTTVNRGPRSVLGRGKGDLSPSQYFTQWPNAPAVFLKLSD